LDNRKIAEHQIVVVSPNPEWNWVPSNVWVGVGQMESIEYDYLINATGPKLNFGAT